MPFYNAVGMMLIIRMFQSEKQRNSIDLTKDNDNKQPSKVIPTSKTIRHVRVNFS